MPPMCSAASLFAGSTQADDDGAGLTQQIIDGDDSAAVLADGSKKGGPGKAVVLGKHTQSEYSLYGSHTAGSTTFTAEPLQEWEVPDCKDHVVSLAFVCCSQALTLQ